MVQKFHLVQTAHEVLSDPTKRATYDRTRGTTNHTTTSYTRSTPTTGPQTPTKNRYARQSTGANGFSKTTPTSARPAKSAFGHFTTREPPSSTRKPATGAKSPPSGFTRPTRPTSKKSPEKDRAEAYFGRFREKTTSWQQFSSSNTPKTTPHAKAQQRREEAQKAAGIKTPERKKPPQTRFGTTFEDELSEEDNNGEETFFSFSSNGGTFNGNEKNNSSATWSERRSAYSHVFTGVKEDVRSPLKTNPQSTGFPSDGSTTKRTDKAPSQNGGTANGLGGFAKETEKKSDAPPAFSLTGQARRKSSQRSTSATTTPPNPNEIPKTPPPVEERRFASAFSRLNVNPSPAKSTPPKIKKSINIEDWTKKFEGMNPFMTPGTKKLSEDKDFWSTAPLRSTPTPVRPIRMGRGRGAKRGGLADMGDLKRELPKMDGGVKFGGLPPVFSTFNVEMPTKSREEVHPTSPNNSVPDPVERTTPNPVLQQPTPAAAPVTFSSNPAIPPLGCPYSSEATEIPVLNAPTPPKLLIPRPSNPKEFSFSVPSKAEMQILAAEVQQYHTAYVVERSRFEETWNKYEAEIQFQFTNEAKVRTYLDVKDQLIKQRAEMESLHTLCLERWGSVAKFSGFTG
jgi:curved DNA-binding protein CbpA